MSKQRGRPLGLVSLVQLQPRGLIVEAPGSSPTRWVYDAGRRVEVDHLEVSERGVEATLPSGERVLDIHHCDHPDKEYDNNDLVSLGFTAHYDAMRCEFGSHMVDGVAGENIIVDYSDEVWPDDLDGALGIENQDTGDFAVLKLVSFASPCAEFGRFCTQRDVEEGPVRGLSEALRFLGKGRRGYLFVPDVKHHGATVRRGDQVFVLHNNE